MPRRPVGGRPRLVAVGSVLCAAALLLGACTDAAEDAGPGEGSGSPPDSEVQRGVALVCIEARQDLTAFNELLIDLIRRGETVPIPGGSADLASDAEQAGAVFLDSLRGTQASLAALEVDAADEAARDELVQVIADRVDVSEVFVEGAVTALRSGDQTVIDGFQGEAAEFETASAALNVRQAEAAAALGASACAPGPRFQ